MHAECFLCSHGFTFHLCLLKFAINYWTKRDLPTPAHTINIERQLSRIPSDQALNYIAH